MHQPLLNVVDYLLHGRAAANHLRPLKDGKPVCHAVRLGVDDMYAEILIRFRLRFIEQAFGQFSRLISPGAFGVQRHMDQIGISFLPAPLKQLGVHVHRHL